MENAGAILSFHNSLRATFLIFETRALLHNGTEGLTIKGSSLQLLELVPENGEQAEG